MWSIDFGEKFILEFQNLRKRERKGLDWIFDAARVHLRDKSHFSAISNP